jgi:flagellar transcriptional activator FlhD
VKSPPFQRGWPFFLVGVWLTRRLPKPDSRAIRRLIFLQQPSPNNQATDPGDTVNKEQLLNDIREANLTYLMLAQNLIRADRTEALFRLGLSEESADLIAQLSPAQILKLATHNVLLCRFRVDDDLVWNLLTSHSAGGAEAGAAGSAGKLHASILMASRFAEAL